MCVNPYYDQILSDFVLFTEKIECWIYLVKNLKMLNLYLVAVILMTDFSCGMEIDSSNDMRSKVSLNKGGNRSPNFNEGPEAYTESWGLELIQNFLKNHS